MDAARAAHPAPDPAASMHPAVTWRVFVGARCNNGCRSCPLESVSTAGEPGEGAAAQSSGGIDVATPSGGIDAAPSSGGIDVPAALETGRAQGADRVFFVGGEPTLHDDLPIWIETARSLGFVSVGVQTNGRRLAYPRYTRRLGDAGLTFVDVSLHGPRAAIHDHHTRAPGSFRQTVAGLGAARAAGLGLGVTSVVTRSSYRHLVELVRVATTLGIDALHLAIAKPVGGAQLRFDALVPRLALVAPQVRAAAKAAGRLGLRLVVSGLPPCFHGDARLPGPGPVGEGGAYGPACQDCPERGACEGLPAAYAERFGFGELHPPADVLPSSERADEARRGWFAGLGSNAP